MTKLFKINTTENITENLFVTSILTIIGGFLDSYTFISRGGIFSNAQTGNVIRVGLEISNGNFKTLYLYLTPIIIFVIFTILTCLLRDNSSKIFKSYIKWYQVALLIEIIMLTAVSFLPASKFDFLANIIVSAVCAIQISSFRKFNGYPFSSTMCTGNFKMACENISIYIQSKEKTNLKAGLLYFYVNFIFILGVIFGALVTYKMHIYSTLVCVFLLLVILIYCFFHIKD